MAEPAPFLRIPPFPGRRLRSLVLEGETAAPGEAAPLIGALCENRVGGSFWGARPQLPAGRDLLMVPSGRAEATAMLAAARRDGSAARAVLVGVAGAGKLPVIPASCDPWHCIEQARELRVSARSEWALVGALLGRALALHGSGRFAALADGAAGLTRVVEQTIAARRWRDPFSGAELSAEAAIARLADWRRLIDANREIAAVFGVARWKRVTMDALLWDGGGPVRHAGAARARSLAAGARVLAWKARTPPATLALLAARGIVPGEIEDGMIRSSGLGAHCVPPLSILVDPQGAHFDPGQPSTLETILEHEDMPEALLVRARHLRERLVAAGIGKYGSAAAAAAPRAHAARRRVLVTGQVEDDRAVLLGGAGTSNRELLVRARAAEPDAEIIYKPHPDVEAGHRRGALADAEVLASADRIERAAPIGTLLASVDAVHVISSLTGFEALCRGVAVTTHGVPFYAGWGLTRDLGPVPARRTRRRRLDELVAAVLILYPRYLDPVSRLPCPPEVLVERMAAGEAAVSSPLVRLRKWQGALMRRLERRAKA
ncbi:MAG: beta-3-deoxy-D-manno-oct-2-ulosonic acid transferase [Sphingomonadales bacterium]|nr:beta-3-deoxy-D-manno-oct-2-ulosonic acid transferase [Sphingomonadales bacterium]